MTLGILPPRRAESEPATQRAPADDGRKAASASDSAPSTEGIAGDYSASVNDYDLIEELSLKQALELAARRAAKQPIENDEDEEDDDV
jgi:hypothetical protein